MPPPPGSSAAAAAAGAAATAAPDAADVLAQEQAVEATALFAVGDWDAAQQTLQRLEAVLPGDARVQLNQEVAGFYADASSGLSDVAVQLAAWLESHSLASDAGYATAAVNYGAIAFLQQQHAQALAVLEPLFEAAERLPDGTMLLLCVLLCEIYLAAKQLPKAASVLQYLQAATEPLTPPPLQRLPSGEAQDGADSQGSGQQQPHSPPRAPKSPVTAARSPSVQQPPHEQQHEEGAAAAASSSCLELPIVSRTQSPLMQRVQALVAQQQQQQGEGGEHGGSGCLAPPDAAALLHVYKARLALACNSHKAAKKELRALAASHPASPAASLLKAQLEVMRVQPKRALKTLAPLLAAASHASVRSRLQLLNLMAALHHQLGKHNLAALYLSTALAQHQAAQQQQQGGPPQPRQERWLLPDVNDALSYNLGLQQLALQDWWAALECFEAAAGAYYTQPQLWLRLAEACIGLYQAHQQAAGTAACQQQHHADAAALLQRAAAHVDTGLRLLQSHQEAASKQLEAAAQATAAAVAAGEPPALLDGPPWLPAAAAAAAAAGAAAEGGAAQHQPGTPGGASPAAAAAAAAALLNTLQPADALDSGLAAVRQALLANQAYVALELGQPQPALEAAQALLASAGVRPWQQQLGATYAAEALCLLGRPQEAAAVLHSHTGPALMQAGPVSSALGGAGGGAADEGARTAAGVGVGVAASIKSDDEGSCKSLCSRSACVPAGGDAAGLQQPDALLLHNMAAVLALQGDVQESERHAAMAAAAAAAATQHAVGGPSFPPAAS